MGDIGGTNARFAVAERGGVRPRLIEPLSLLCADYATAAEAINHYFSRVATPRPVVARIAVAGPVDKGAVQSTNSPWRLTESDLRAQGFADARLLNDYAALALAAPILGPEDLAAIGPSASASPGLTLAVLGAGTGFGVAALARGDGADIPVSTEGGHIAFAPSDAVETHILQLLSARFGRVSVERILSGPGLSDLHWALARIDGADADPRPASEIVARGLAGDDALCAATLDRFCAIYGAVAGDLALALGARGGVFLAGGIAPRLLGPLREGEFRQRFEAKGRFAGFMAAIPTQVITHPYAALIGAALAQPSPPAPQGDLT